MVGSNLSVYLFLHFAPFYGYLCCFVFVQGVRSPSHVNSDADGSVKVNLRVKRVS